MCVPGCQETVRAALSRRGFFKGAAAAGFAATAVAAEAAPKPAPRRFKATVDLTHTMSPEFPTFFGVPGIEVQKQFDFKKDGFNLNWWRIIEHAGTHIDAPIHFSESGETVDKLPAETLVAPLAVIDVRSSAAKNSDYLVSRHDLAEWEKKNRKLPDRCCVAMLSGWGDYTGDGAKYTGASGGTFHFPGFSRGGRRVASEGAQRGGTRGRHAVARSRAVQGLQGASALAADRALGPRERRQSRQGTRRGRDAGGGCSQGEKRNRRSGPADCTRLIHRFCASSIPKPAPQFRAHTVVFSRIMRARRAGPLGEDFQWAAIRKNIWLRFSARPCWF